MEKGSFDNVYRGAEFPELIGKYIFGDNMSNKIWTLDETTVPATKVLLATLPKGPGPNLGDDYTGLESFGVDADGVLYMCQLSRQSGHIYNLQRGGGRLRVPGFLRPCHRRVSSPIARRSRRVPSSLSTT